MHAGSHIDTCTHAHTPAPGLSPSDRPVTLAITQEAGPREYVSFLKPNVTIEIVDHFQAYPKKGIPPQVRTGVRFVAVI